MVNLVIVSHSSRLGEGVGELARQMLMSDSLKIAIAAGIDDHKNPIGTDAVKVMEAIESVADADHVLVMMDMGSALLKRRNCAGIAGSQDRRKSTFVRCAVGRRYTGSNGQRGLGSGYRQMFLTLCMRWKPNVNNWVYLSSDTKISDTCPAYDEEARSLAVVIKNRNGLHVRPASRLVLHLIDI